MINDTPMMLLMVIVSENRMDEAHNVNNMDELLNRYALFNGV